MEVYYYEKCTKILFLNCIWYMFLLWGKSKQVVFQIWALYLKKWAFSKFLLGRSTKRLPLDEICFPFISIFDREQCKCDFLPPGLFKHLNNVHDFVCVCVCVCVCVSVCVCVHIVPKPLPSFVPFRWNKKILKKQNVIFFMHNSESEDVNSSE